MRGKPKRVGLVSCTKSKLPRAAPAKDLYSPSALFRGQRAYVERTCDRWFILSAKYGLVDPDHVIEPYEQTLRTASTAVRQAWSADVLRSLTAELGDIHGITFECHAGRPYLDNGLVHGIIALGGLVERPAEGLTMGRQLAFYAGKSGGPRLDPPKVPARPDLVVTGPPAIPPPVTNDQRRAVVDALLTFGATLDTGQLVAIGPDPESDRLIREDGFAFLLAVIFDEGIKFERAWRAPFELQQRLGSIDPSFLVENPAAVRDAVARPVALHRYIDKTPVRLVAAADRVLSQYSGDAERIWNDSPTAETLRRRLEEFSGIGQKKAAMAVEILERQRGAVITHLEGSDIAFDVHVRRVFLRSGLADRDEQTHMIQVARALNAERPGALDYPTWWIGHEWCRPDDPLCGLCPLGRTCSKLLQNAVNVQ